MRPGTSTAISKDTSSGQGASPWPCRWARWEGRDRNRRSIEIDVVARLDDGRLLTGEVNKEGGVLQEHRDSAAR